MWVRMRKEEKSNLKLMLQALIVGLIAGTVVGLLLYWDLFTVFSTCVEVIPTLDNKLLGVLSILHVCGGDPEI